MVPYTPETLAVLTAEHSEKKPGQKSAQLVTTVDHVEWCIELFNNNPDWDRNYRGQYRDYNHHSYRQCSLTASL